jgi:hypothetical protein
MQTTAKLLMTGLVLTTIAQVGIVLHTVFDPIAEVAQGGKPEPGRTRGNDPDRRIPSDRW